MILTNVFNFIFIFDVLMIPVVLLKIVFILIAVAYFTIAERKVMASIQRRLGPNVEGGPFGLLQPLADGLKLVIKELAIPNRANIVIFLLAPVSIFILSLTGWSVIPFYPAAENIFFDINQYTPTLVYNFITVNRFISDIKFGVLFLLALSSLNVYGIILGGWASNSKYAFLGALRSAAQMISYEVSIGLTILPAVMLSGSFNLFDIVMMQDNTIWFFIPLAPSVIIFFISMLAETNRAPFDLPEAEAELVAGYNVEYGSMAFALFFLGEYSSMLLMSSLICLIFMGGWLIPLVTVQSGFLASLAFAFKISVFSFLYILVRATFPRYRYDQLMDIGWKIFLPLTLGLFLLISAILLTFDMLPFSVVINTSAIRLV